jgi:hypothetical protein
MSAADSSFVSIEDKVDPPPGIYFDQGCTYFLMTVPGLFLISEGVQRPASLPQSWLTLEDHPLLGPSEASDPPAWWPTLSLYSNLCFS